MSDYTCKGCTHEFDKCDAKVPIVCLGAVMCPCCDSIEIIFNNDEDLF